MRTIESAVADCAKEYDSFYLYDERTIIERTERLISSFPEVSFLYSMKCNSDPNVTKCVFKRGFGADAASLNEVLAAREYGLEKESIYYSAPGKTVRDVEGALSCCTLIADSIGEVERIERAAERMGEAVGIGLRVNPDFSFSGDCGCASKFGVDERIALDFLKSRGASKRVGIVGLHVHIKSQELDADALIEYYSKVLRLADRFEQACGSPLKFVNMGSGMGVPCKKGDAPLDTAKLGAAAGELGAAFHSKHGETKLLIEVGRYAVCESGVYVAKVLDRKTSHGKTYLILKNTLNGFMRPSLARFAERCSPLGAKTAPSEPLFSSTDAFEFRALGGGADTERVTLVGSICTSSDVVAEDILLPKLDCGDAVLITNAGSYGAALSPMQFSSQEKPVELYLTLDGEIRKRFE